MGLDKIKTTTGSLLTESLPFVHQFGHLSNNSDKTMFAYFNYPHSLSIRDIATVSDVPKSTVSEYLRAFKSSGFIDGSSLYLLKKIHFEIERIVRSGLIDFIVKKMNPSVIILFGSIRKGEYTFESDIDVFVESYSPSPSLKKYESELGRPIQMFVESSLSKLPQKLRDNVINGIKLYGSVVLK